MAVNKPVGDNARKGAARKRSQPSQADRNAVEAKQEEQRVHDGPKSRENIDGRTAREDLKPESGGAAPGDPMKGLDSRTKANMEVVLDRVCRDLPHGGDHSLRRAIAESLVVATRKGETTLGALEALARRKLKAAQR
jgi:hypothetical protein